MRTEKVTAIRKQPVENFPIGYFSASYSILLNYSHFLKMFLRIHATLTIYVTQQRHSWVCRVWVNWQKIKKLKHRESSALTSFTGYAKKWVKKNKTSMFKPVLSGAVEVYKPVNVGWLRLLENSFVYYCITAKGKNSAVGGFSYTEFSCNRRLLSSLFTVHSSWQFRLKSMRISTSKLAYNAVEQNARLFALAIEISGGSFKYRKYCVENKNTL